MFGGKVHLQSFGGPIGARLTMSVARQVVQEWNETYRRILKDCGKEELLRAIYVDDSKGMVTKLNLGERIVLEQRKLIHNESQEIEDKNQKKSREDITDQEIKNVINSINEDLVFTT